MRMLVIIDDQQYYNGVIVLISSVNRGENNVTGLHRSILKPRSEIENVNNK